MKNKYALAEQGEEDMMKKSLSSSKSDKTQYSVFTIIKQMQTNRSLTRSQRYLYMTGALLILSILVISVVQIVTIAGRGCRIPSMSR